MLGEGLDIFPCCNQVLCPGAWPPGLVRGTSAGRIGEKATRGSSFASGSCCGKDAGHPLRGREVPEKSKEGPFCWPDRALRIQIAQAQRNIGSLNGVLELLLAWILPEILVSLHCALAWDEDTVNLAVLLSICPASLPQRPAKAARVHRARDPESWLQRAALQEGEGFELLRRLSLAPNQYS